LPGGRVRLERRGPVAWVVLDRPEKLNALDEGMWRQLASTLRDACGGPEAVVALRGEGRALCTGDDIKAMLNLGSIEESRRFFSAVREAVESLMECGKPVAMLVNGYAFGGCAEILLLADYVVAIDGSLIAFPEVRLGLIPPIASSLGPTLTGRRIARLLVTGSPVSAREARELGIVDEVVGSEGEALEAIERFAEEVAAAEPRAVAVTRRLLASALNARVLEDALRALEEMVLSEQAKTRMRAFLESRRAKSGKP